MALAFSEFALTSGRKPLSVCIGPDGNPWWVANPTGAASILGTLDPDTEVVTEYTCPDASSADLQDLCLGPDGNLWIVGYTSNKIYKVTTGGSWTSYSSGITASAGLYSICSGPDGNLWFAELGQIE